MSMYNQLFGMNPMSDLLLAAVGLHRNDIERFRDCSYNPEGGCVDVYTRTGGGNRDDYPNLVMRSVVGWVDSEDDEFDCTYCTDTINVHPRWIRDVSRLAEPLKYGLRAPFARHLAATLQREPTAKDLEVRAVESERAALARVAGTLANGHTFVPYDDQAMETALKLAEANGGELRSCWGVLPLRLEVKTDHAKYGQFKRVDIDYVWTTDESYLEHCVTAFAAKYPLAVAKMTERSKPYSAAKAAR